MNSYSVTSSDGPKEACGVFGVWAPGEDVARITFFALYALQHRGQESAGIATCDGHAAYTHRGMGLVTQVFNEDNLRPLKGHMAIGHTRYSTSGASQLRNAQPYLIETLDGPLGVAHNGNLIDGLALRQKILSRGVGLMSSSDTEVIAQMLAAPVNGESQGEVDWESRIRNFIDVCEGAYSLTLMTRDAIYGVRDPYGFRPLCLGEVYVNGEQRGYALASESCALQTVGARFVREIEPGEFVRLDNDGVTSFRASSPPQRRASCTFEHVYFARPDSHMSGDVVHQARQRMGRELAFEAPVDADVVIGVPDSALPAAIGYALTAGIPYNEGLTKNRYIGRTFIQPDPARRRDKVMLKYNALRPNLEGKRVVVLDDSIVRGNTSGPLIRLLKEEGGAREVHVRISSPPVRHPCYMGVDMATYDELIAHRMSVEEICHHIGADSLAYLSIEGMMRAITDTTGEPKDFCTACFSGQYPISVGNAAAHANSGEVALERIQEL